MPLPILSAAIALVFSLTFAAALRGDSARAIYYTENRDIVKMNPDGSGRVVLFPNGSPQGFYHSLRIDAANGHLYWLGGDHTIYRGNLDGTGVRAIVTIASGSWDFVVDVPNQTIYYAIDRGGIYQYDMVAETSTPIFEVTDILDLIGPRLFFDGESSAVYWTEVRGRLSTPGDQAGVPIRIDLPILALSGEMDVEHSTEVLFDSGIPVPYSVGRHPDFITYLVTGGLDGNDATVIDDISPIELIGPLRIGIDEESGFIYYAGLRYEEGFRPGIFRTKLDGSEYTILSEANAANLVVDTADLNDTTEPVVSIFSPIGGTTNNQVVALIGSVSDDTALTGVTWSHGGVEQGAVELFDGDFTVPSVALHPGENLLEVRATDLAGNVGTSQVVLSWQPLRSVTVSNPPSVREGHRVEIQTLLDSPGEVAGMTFTLHYDPAFFEAPDIEFGDAIASASPSANTLTAGEVNATFASPAETVPEGEQILVTASLRARSVAATASTDLQISVEDMADSEGDPILVGTFTGSSSIEVQARTFVGDINSNDRLDTGDSSRMQAMLTGISEKRPWDEQVNDLNQSTTLDSGDVIRVLRAVVQIDPQPADPQPMALFALAEGPGGAVLGDPEGPRARLSLSAEHGAAGEEIVVTVDLDDSDAPITGAAFTLDYPSEFLRLENSAAHSPGPVVGGDAFLLWNLAPSQNDYANQSGSIIFGASSSSAWPGSASGGRLAEFRFTVTSATGAPALVPISIRDAEISVDSGFEVVPVTGDTAAWIASAQSFAAWQALHYDELELPVPAVSGWGADSDGDGFDNGTEFFAGTDPKDGHSRPSISHELVSSDGDAHCLALTYRRAPWAVGASALLQVSTDLANWQDITDATTDSSVDFDAGTETIRAQFAPPETGGHQYARLKIKLSE